LKSAGDGWKPIKRGDFHGYSLRTERWRYTLWDDGKKGEQLFDMHADPKELTNLAAPTDLANVVKDLREQVRSYAGGVW
jgi:iduronate 2-sulfatase